MDRRLSPGPPCDRWPIARTAFAHRAALHHSIALEVREAAGDHIAVQAGRVSDLHRSERRICPRSQTTISAFWEARRPLLVSSAAARRELMGSAVAASGARSQSTTVSGLPKSEIWPFETIDRTETGRKPHGCGLCDDAKELMEVDRRSAKPLFVGSTPIRASKHLAGADSSARQKPTRV